MKILMTLENVVMDGTKRAAVVMGNTLAKKDDVTFYSLEAGTTFFPLSAPLVTAKRPASATVLNFRGSKPYKVYADQIQDLVDYIIDNHFTSVILTAGLLASFAPFIKAKAPNVNVISWMHNNFETYMHQYYKSMDDELEKGLAISDTVVTLTHVDRDKYRDYSDNVKIIYNPLTLRAQYHADLTSHIIAFTARIDIQHKGIDFLMEAASYLPDDWKIAMAGAGTDEAMQQFNDLMDKFKVRDKIIYRGPLKDAGLQKHYASASIFASTSRWEGLPLVIGEAMDFGLPIIAMENTGSRELLRDNKWGILTKPKDVSDFVANLKRLIADFDLREHYSKQSLYRIIHFLPETIAQDWGKILK